MCGASGSRRKVNRQEVSLSTSEEQRWMMRQE